MTHAFATRLSAHYAALPAQMQKAARWVLEHPQDAALLSMREQARRAGVQPATMTRLAQALGFDGYDAVRALHAHSMRHAQQGLSGRAGERLPLEADSVEAAAQAMLTHAGDHIGQMIRPDLLDALAQAAQILGQARRVFSLGRRSSHAVAWHFHYALSLVSDRAHYLGDAAGSGLDPLLRAGPQDALLVCGVAPYTRSVVEAVAQAHAQRVPVVALTDGPLSPLIVPDAVALIVPTDSASFLHSMTPAFLIAEILAALVARADDPATLARLDGLDRQLAALNTFFHDPKEVSP